MTQNTPAVDISGVTVTYHGCETPALKNLDLRVERGEFIVITGPSGCGKSTLALCLTGFIPHSVCCTMSGRVMVAGLDTREYLPGMLAGVVGLVQQDPEAQLCTLRVKDEVAFGPENLCLTPGEIGLRVKKSLAAVGAEHLSGREVHTLSGGEKQRVAIASVLAMEPDVIILDEPTANLDPHCTMEVLAVMEKLKKKNVSVIVIEHRLEKLLPLCDRVVVMEKGEIAGILPPTQFNKVKAAVAPVWRERGATPHRRADDDPLLEVQELSAGYPGKQVLRDVGFSVYPGETVAIMGDNGSGKTSLLLALLGILKPDGGLIKLKGRAVSHVGVSGRARFMGLTFQNPNHQIFEQTVLREAGLASRFLCGEGRRPDEARILGLLEEFGLLVYRDRVPFALSLGEKKRLVLVSVLAYEPELLLLDEPLAGQDEGRLRQLMEVLEARKKKGCATLMICHEPAVVAAFCDRVLFFSEGRLIVDDGVKEAFRRLKALGKDEYVPGPVQQVPVSGGTR